MAKSTRVGPQLPADLGKNVNGGLPINDPASLEVHERGARGASDEQRNPARIVVDEETGKVMTDAPEPVKPTPRVMRELELSDGPNVDPNTGAYRPAIYRTRRQYQKKDGEMVEHSSIRQDH